jgi:hypothetical protein
LPTVFTYHFVPRKLWILLKEVIYSLTPHSGSCVHVVKILHMVWLLFIAFPVSVPFLNEIACHMCVERMLRRTNESPLTKIPLTSSF